MRLSPLIRRVVLRRAVDGRDRADRTAKGVAHLVGGVVLALAIAGCASHDGISVPGPATTVGNDEAMVLPPPGGPAIVNVIQHNFNNAVRQDIFLFTSASAPGQNVLRATFFGPVGLSYDGRESLGYTSVRDSGIDREMRQEFPGVAMARAGIYVQNNYGPFGYAVGRSRQGDACIYAWQQIRSNQNSRGTFQNRGTIQLRLRLCDAHQTQEQLLAVMYGLTISGTFQVPGWNPYDSAPPVDPTLGRSGNPIYPGVVASHANQPPPAFQPKNQTPSPVVARSRPAAIRRTIQAEQPAQPIGPAVPLPNQPAQGAQAVPNPVIVPSPNCTSAGTDACK